MLRYKLQHLEELILKFKDSECFKVNMPRENPQVENHGIETHAG